MKEKKFFWFLLFLLLMVLLVIAGAICFRFINKDGFDLNLARSLVNLEPSEVTELRQREVPQSEEGHQEYYFKLLNEDEKRGYREMLDGIRERKEEFYITISEDQEVDRAYHALLKDHPELYWVHNREQVYKTTFSRGDYCIFSPGYLYTQEEMKEIDAAIENAYQEVMSLLPHGASEYEKAKTVYAYLIDSVEYETSADDQNIAGAFWKHKAVCAGYAGSAQYLLEKLDVVCLYVEGSAKGSEEGHAWNIVRLDGQYYYLDATNGDQPAFLEGDAVSMVEHKTTIYDYLCPFPEDYEMNYTPSEEFALPKVEAVDKNFYVLNQGCFSSYNRQEIYEYCCMRLDNGAAVVRFKFSNQEAFAQAYSEWIENGAIQSLARYYMELYHLESVEYHYGILEDLKTMYFMF